MKIRSLITEERGNKVSGKGEKEQVYARYVASGKTVQHLASWGKTLAEVMNPEGKPEVLDDILVLDVSLANFSGIIAASFFAEFGAEVIKIEPPDGDPARMITPYGENVKGVGIPFLVEGRNKRYMTLDLKNSSKDREDFAKLAEKAAVVIETFAAGEMDSWGIGYRQLSQKNPGMIYIAITPYGQYTDKAREFARLPDADITAQAGSGLPAQVGDPSNQPGALRLAIESRDVGRMVYIRSACGYGRLLCPHSSPEYGRRSDGGHSHYGCFLLHGRISSNDRLYLG